MGARGGSAPSGLPQRLLKTLLLRAPYTDWAALSQSVKTEFRIPLRGRMGADRYDAPTPIVLYAVSPTLKEGPRRKLMVLTGHRVEVLMDIRHSAESLANEGFPSYDHFRRYWRARTRRPYVPLAKVEVFTLAAWPADRPSSEGVAQWLGSALLHRLYGDYLP